MPWPIGHNPAAKRARYQGTEPVSTPPRKGPVHQHHHNGTETRGSRPQNRSGVNVKNTPSRDPFRVSSSIAKLRRERDSAAGSTPNPYIEVVGIGATPDEALNQVGDCNAEIAVIDAPLPEKAGPRLCRQIRERHPTTQYILLTMFSTDRNDVEHAGAAAVVLKQPCSVLLQVTGAAREVRSPRTAGTSTAFGRSISGFVFGSGDVVLYGVDGSATKLMGTASLLEASHGYCRC